jgi:hypothetical protein
MAEQVFAIYKQYGLTNRDDIIISKEFRDSHPLPTNCWDRRRESDWHSLKKTEDGDGMISIIDTDTSTHSLTAFLNTLSSIQSFLYISSQTKFSSASASKRQGDKGGEPEGIPTMPMLNFVILTGLLGWFGLRR